MFYFTVVSSEINRTLELFGDMFLNPRFEMSRLKIDVGVVDQEFRDGLQDDAYRLEMVSRVTGGEVHPYTGSFGGNDESLLGNGYVALQRALRDLHKTMYSSHRMRLVVMGSGKPPDLANLQTPSTNRSRQLSPSSASCPSVLSKMSIAGTPLQRSPRQPR